MQAVELLPGARRRSLADAVLFRGLAVGADEALLVEAAAGLHAEAEAERGRRSSTFTRLSVNAGLSEGPGRPRGPAWESRRGSRGRAHERRRPGGSLRRTGSVQLGLNTGC
ncbi:hypothetical protein EYF80_042070 [Liparis tanakae]|uniref:Uncharacterized protein n=1 Tax=Liparis tanakae TaxID=230148 RepID=A0A4Z2G368_9TELE|nr:hypothetical protein EYF80_042070 [Liparis tanakae]